MVRFGDFEHMHLCSKIHHQVATLGAMIGLDFCNALNRSPTRTPLLDEAHTRAAGFAPVCDQAFLTWDIRRKLF